MWGIIPAAGAGRRIQPLAFSKELLPVGSRLEDGVERPRAVCEYLLERMILAGARRICFVIGSGKCDIIQYFGANFGPAALAYVVQPHPAGLCDALFRAVPLIAEHEPVLVGLPDTIWFPEHGFCALPNDRLSFLLFSVRQPELFDAVLTTPEGAVREMRVKQPEPGTRWVWGAFKLPGRELHRLCALWRERDCRDEYVGTLVNAWLATGGKAAAIRAGEAYVDVGTLHGYREAIRLLHQAGAAGRSAAFMPRQLPHLEDDPSGAAVEKTNLRFVRNSSFMANPSSGLDKAQGGEAAPSKRAL